VNVKLQVIRKNLMGNKLHVNTKFQVNLNKGKQNAGKCLITCNRGCPESMSRSRGRGSKKV